MNKKVLIGGIALLLVGSLSYLAIGTAFADETDRPRNPLIQKIVERFNLDQEEVEQFIEEQEEIMHQEMQERRRTEVEQKLSEAVENGTITEEHKALLLAKMEEHMNQREEDMDNWKELSREERQEMMEQHRTEFDAWAEENGIDLEALDIHGGEFGIGGPGGHRGQGPRGDMGGMKDGFGFGAGMGSDSEIE